MNKNLLKISFVTSWIIVFCFLSGVLVFSSAYADMTSQTPLSMSLAENPFSEDSEKVSVEQNGDDVKIVSAITYSDVFKGNLSYTWHYKLDGSDEWVDIDCTTDTLDFDTSKLTLGDYIFQIVARDDLGNVCTQDFKITVYDNKLPSKGVTDSDGLVTLNDNKQDPTKDKGGDNIGNTTVKVTDKDGHAIEGAVVEIDDDGKIVVTLPEGTEEIDVIIKVTDSLGNPIKDKLVKVVDFDGSVRIDALSDDNGEVYASVKNTENNESTTVTTDNSSDKTTDNSSDKKSDKESGKGLLPTTGDKMLDFVIAAGVVGLIAAGIVAIITYRRRKEE